MPASPEAFRSPVRLAVFLVTVLGVAAPSPAATAPPPNDDFANPTSLHDAIDGASVKAARGTNAEAGKEVGEPSHAGNVGGASVWFTWTAYSSDPVKVETCGSDFDTLLAVYTGTAVDGLTEVASSDDSPECGVGSDQSALSFEPTSGTTYRIAVDGANVDGAATGTYEIRLPPTNDDFADASMLLSGEHVFGTNRSATKEPGEPNHTGSSDPEQGSVWYRWEAPAWGSASFELCSEHPGATHLAIYRGGSLTSLVRVGGGQRTAVCSTFTSPTRRDTTYRIAVDGGHVVNGMFEGDPFDLILFHTPDTVAPETTITGLRINDATNAVSVRFRATDPGITPVSFQCRLDRRPWRSCTSPKRFGNLSEGAHTVRVRGVDAEGNVDPTPAKRRFSVD